MSRLPALIQLHAADPKDGELCYMIALEYAKADNDITAVEWFDKGLAANPSLHYAYFQKAKAQSRLGMMDAAVFTAEVGIAKAQADGNGKAFGELQELLVGFQAE